MIPTPEQLYPRGYDYPVASAAWRLLNTIVDTFESKGATLPRRRYVTVGRISAVDTDQLVVMFGGIYVGPPGNELTSPVRGDSPRSMSLNVELWRKVPSLTATGNAPSPEAISASSEVLMHDSWLLIEAGYAFDYLKTGIIANAGVHEPQGEYAGVSMTLESQVS